MNSKNKMGLKRNVIVICLILSVIGLGIAVTNTHILAYTAGFTLAGCSILAIAIVISEGILRQNSS